MRVRVGVRVRVRVRVGLANRLARAGGRSHEHVLVGVVHGVEDLRLHGVEVLEAPHLRVEGVEGRVTDEVGVGGEVGGEREREREREG